MEQEEERAELLEKVKETRCFAPRRAAEFVRTYMQPSTK
jgi:hypothetical protein